MQYRPLSFAAGLAIAALALFVLIAVVVWDAARYRVTLHRGPVLAKDATGNPDREAGSSSRG